MVARILRWLSGHWRRLVRRRWVVSFYATQSEVPAQPRKRTIAVIGPRNAPKWATFECPCDRGHVISLNLSTTREPFWSIDTKTVSVSPSVDSSEIDRCHYFIRGGGIQWV